MKNLLAEADQAFSLGDNERGLLLLREYNENNLNDPGAWHRQAIIEEQIGEQSRAGQAHFESIKLAPDIAIGYLYAGYWLQQQGKLDAAAAAYSLLDDLSPGGLTRSSNAPESIKMRATSANQLLRRFLSAQHRELCDHADLSRIRNSIWVRTHDAGFALEESDFQPQLFYIPKLPRKPVFRSTDFSWTAELASKTDVIRTELTAALQNEGSENTLRPYLAGEFDHGPLQELAGSVNWSALDLYREGVENASISSKFPETLKALNTVPHYSLGDNPYEVFFSLLKPKQTIAPHYGLSNHALTVHLALDIPNDCYLTVAGKKIAWQEGELMIFDDSFLHSAHNESDRLRIVLIFSIWNPELTKQEIQAIQNSFIARKNWLASRVEKLTELQQ